jgi:hypothetical protein
MLRTNFEHRDGEAIVGTSDWPSGQVDCARGCTGRDAEVSALPGGLRGTVHGLRHIVGGSQVRLVVCCDQLCCGFALFSGDGRAWALQEAITSRASKRAAGFMPVVSDSGD